MSLRLIQQRLLLFVPVLFLVSLIIFGIVRVLPGDAAVVMLTAGGEGRARAADIAQLRHELGLDQPLPQQYGQWLLQIARLDLGQSFYTGRPVVGEIAERLPRTLELALFTMLIAGVLAIPLGILAAVYQDGPLDQVVRIISVGGVALPNFWVGTLLILALVSFFAWLPPIGYVPFWSNPGVHGQQIVFPAMALGFRAAAVLMRMTRSAMLEVLRQDYVRTARAKGLAERLVLVRHSLPNASLPLLTLGGVELTALLGGSVVIEIIFVLPGMGSLLVESILRRDYFVTQGTILVFALIVLIVNFLVDIAYVWVNPRLRFR